MRTASLLMAASAAAFMLAAAAVVPAAAGQPPSGAAYVPGEVIVKYAGGTTRRERNAVKRQTGTHTAQALPEGSRVLEVAGGESVPAKAAELEASPAVEYAVPNYIARASGFMPNDPGRVGRPGGWSELQWNFFGPFGINAIRAWELAAAAGASGGKGAVVAVLDTGVAYQTRGRFRRAPDLPKHRWRRGYDFVDGDRFPNDENGHGTHVAGTIAQVTNNGRGLTGLAYRATIMPVRVLDNVGEGDAAVIAEGIRYAARRGAHVINLSLEFDSSVAASDVPDVLRAIRYAHRRGATIVGAAGNQASSVAYPARASRVISVGGTTEHGCRAEYSSSGRGLDVIAPGGGSDAAPSGSNAWDAEHCRPERGGRDIFQQTFRRSGAVQKFGIPSGYQGTSMAAPHVSAIAALVIATRRLGPGASPAAVRQRIMQTAHDIGPPGRDSSYGAGLADAAAAVAP